MINFILFLGDHTSSIICLNMAIKNVIVRIKDSDLAHSFLLDPLLDGVDGHSAKKLGSKF